MKKIDNVGLMLCKLQGQIFEQSVHHMRCSSAVFIREYMLSNVAQRMDSQSFLNETTYILDVYDELNAEYGECSYGSTHYTGEELFWIGYIYRYMCYTYNVTSKYAYNLINASELKKLYYAYHSFDPAFAIDRILEAKNIVLGDYTRRGVEILRALRSKNK